MYWGRLVQVGGSDINTTRTIVWNMEADDNIVGRLHDNTTFTLLKPYISAKHFSISRNKLSDTDSTYRVSDFSSNGTFLNDVLIGKGKSNELHHGDRISIKFRGDTKAIFEFECSNINPTEEPDLPPNKSQRTENGKRLYSSMEDSGESSSGNINSSKRLAALERESKQQEQRISGYITKLESTAREVGNLQRDLKEAKDEVKQRDAKIAELTQNRLALESSTAALEARCRHLDESLASMRQQVEQQREQLRASEEMSSSVAELRMRFDNLTDELNHKRTQHESALEEVEEISAVLKKERQAHALSEEQQAVLRREVENLSSALSASRLRENELSGILGKMKGEVDSQRVAWTASRDGLLKYINELLCQVKSMELSMSAALEVEVERALRGSYTQEEEGGGAGWAVQSTLADQPTCAEIPGDPFGCTQLANPHMDSTIGDKCKSTESGTGSVATTSARPPSSLANRQQTALDTIEIGSLGPLNGKDEPDGVPNPDIEGMVSPQKGGTAEVQAENNDGGEMKVNSGKECMSDGECGKEYEVSQDAEGGESNPSSSDEDSDVSVGGMA
mmetsp:Transcript_13637/g.20440  ORF Transcript_13637/g.20440 Transcript_13637/m.20440 type:complete len:566 (+) Transcript_13637:122-1819(+)